MQISKVKIHNFRSIINGEFVLGYYSMLIGANNAGKSNVIDALRVFYEKDEKYNLNRDKPKIRNDGVDTDQSSWIEIEYLLNEEEAVSLKSEYLSPGNKLSVRKLLTQSGDKAPGIYAYEGDQLSGNLFYGAKGVQLGKLGKVIYIPAVSKLEDETKLSGPSPLRDILNDILDNLIASSKAYKKLTGSFDTFKKEIKAEETEDKKSLTGLEVEINREISEWGLAFDLEINAVTQLDIIKNLIGFQIIDSKLERAIDAQQQGHGFQRHLIYTLIRVSTKYQTKTLTTKSKDFQPDFTLILFEEPEAFLHPSQQDSLCLSLKKLAKQDSHQVLVSSHSPRFVSHNTFDLSSLIRLCRGNQDAQTIIGQITQENFKKFLNLTRKLMISWQTPLINRKMMIWN